VATLIFVYFIGKAMEYGEEKGRKEAFEVNSQGGQAIAHEGEGGVAA
jgi:hypothetical protein